MVIAGYKCKECKGGFEDMMSTDPEESVEIKCPFCGSMDVEQSDEVSEFLELIQEMGSTGG